MFGECRPGGDVRSLGETEIADLWDAETIHAPSLVRRICRRK